MGIESELYYFSGSDEAANQPLTRQEELSLKISSAANEAMSTTKRVAAWDPAARTALEGAVIDSLAKLHEMVGGRLSTLSCISTVYNSKGRAAEVEVVKQGEPQNVLFDTQALDLPQLPSPHEESLRGARLVFGKAFDLFTSNVKTSKELNRLRELSRRYPEPRTNGTKSSMKRIPRDSEVNAR